MRVRQIIFALTAVTAVSAAPYRKNKCHHPSNSAGYSAPAEAETTPATMETEINETPAYTKVYSTVKAGEIVYSTATYPANDSKPTNEAEETIVEIYYSTAVDSSVAPEDTAYSTEVYSTVEGTETAYSTAVYSTVEPAETYYSTEVYSSVENTTVEATETETGTTLATYVRPPLPTTTYEPDELTLLLIRAVENDGPTETEAETETELESEPETESETETETSTPSPLPKKLKILHTNDIHSHLDQFTSSGTDCRQSNIDTNTCYGGIARIKRTVDDIRANTTTDTLLFDAGDQFQGTLFFNVFGGSKVAEFMNSVKYDVMAIGNHEFDNGEEYLYEFLSNLTFPVLSSNIDLGDTYIKNVVKPYTVIEKYGLGIIGFITNTTADITLGALGVVLSSSTLHNGYDHDKYLAENVPGISLIVGGHSHSLLLKNTSAPGVVGPYPTAVTNPEGKKTWIVQSYRWGNYLGNVEVE
ncbi:hypothetical protein HK097_005109 [Rhizophlyctis rosea]|uniref:Calcineurin-like phosphoesterase domain-containing protein n=1 Tax=Rhizophlyctis rosea TaxID=64517 RepID=A0AAD5X2L1_9FUNG|nr:hypothetical protein HK097_005109 [Rhizophlyctis rosea]